MAQPRWTALVAMATVTLAACAQPGQGRSTEGDSGAHVSATSPEAIGFGEALAQIRGHHLVSLELYEAGDLQGARVHAGHPIAEILTSVRSELEEHDAAVGDDLAAALDEGLEAIGSRQPVNEVEAAYGEVAEVTRDALEAVVGDAARSASYRGSVIAALLATAAHEYEEAVGGKGIRLVAEYQDGYGFVREARRLYEDIAGDVEAASAEEADEVEEAFATLEGALSSPEPPAQPASVVEVESAAKLIGHELEETIDAAPVEVSDPEEIVAEIEGLLDEIVATYEAGDPDAAAELSAEAYLENYEVIEAEVIDQAPEVNEELEPLLGAELRRRIEEGAAVGEIEDMTERAKELLKQALLALEEH